MKRGAITAIALALTAGLAHADSFHVIFSTTTLLPGETLRVELDGVAPGLKSSMLFRGRTYPFFPVGPDAQRALVGIPLSTSPGVYSVRVKEGAVTTEGPETARWRITVATKTFQIENINFKPETNALTAYEHRESMRIRKAARRMTPDQSWEGVFSAPVDGPSIAPFGLKRMHNGATPAGFHNGIDLRAPKGTPVRSANAGVIEMAATLKAHGKVVLINHGQGIMTIYLHMSKLLVKPGQRVAKGQTIGLVGSTGMSTAPHVHWQVFVHGVPVDPDEWTSNEY